jgi:hypothetical protein
LRYATGSYNRNHCLHTWYLHCQFPQTIR